MASDKLNISSNLLRNEKMASDGFKIISNLLRYEKTEWKNEKRGRIKCLKKSVEKRRGCFLGFY